MKYWVLSCVFAVAVPALASAASRSDDIQPGPHEKTSATALHQDMRKLWSDHVIWTRSYIIAAVGDQPDQQAAADRLMKNQEDIGNAIAGIYGKPAGDKLTTLLKEHISIAVDIIKSPKRGTKPRSRKPIGSGTRTARRSPTS